jgi:hypothetical protein
LLIFALLELRTILVHSWRRNLIKNQVIASPVGERLQRRELRVTGEHCVSPPAAWATSGPFGRNNRIGIWRGAVAVTADS